MLYVSATSPAFNQMIKFKDFSIIVRTRPIICKND